MVRSNHEGPIVTAEKREHHVRRIRPSRTGTRTRKRKRQGTRRTVRGPLAPPPWWPHAPGRHPHRAARGPQRGPGPRLRRHQEPRGEERWGVEAQPRLGVPDAPAARGRRAGALDRARRQAGLRDHRRRPRRSGPSHRGGRRHAVGARRAGERRLRRPAPRHGAVARRRQAARDGRHARSGRAGVRDPQRRPQEALRTRSRS